MTDSNYQSDWRYTDDRMELRLRLLRSFSCNGGITSYTYEFLDYVLSQGLYQSLNEETFDQELMQEYLYWYYNIGPKAGVYRLEEPV